MTYHVKYQENGKIKTKVLEEEQYLKKNLPNNIIEIKKKNETNQSLFTQNKKISNKELINSLYELNLMLEANLLLDDALEILIENTKKENLKEFFKKLKIAFSNYLDINKSLKEFKVDFIVKALFQITQDNGNIKDNINILYEILNEEYETKKELKKVFAYPLILLVSFFLALYAIFKVVVPKFEYMFTQNDISLSFSTKVLFQSKYFFENYSLIFLSICSFFIFLIYIIYKNNSKSKYFIQKFIFLKIPVLSTIYRYQQFYRYFTVINSLLNSKYEFYETLNKSKSLISNKYFLDKITKIDNLLKSGKSISYSFSNAEIFDDIILNMIKTAEKTNSLTKVSFDIKNIYKKRFTEKVKFFSLFIEPAFFILIMGLIIWIVLAIFVPLWSMSDILKV